MADIMIWILIVLLAILAGVVLLSVYWQYRMGDDLKSVFTQLRQVQQAAAQKRAESTAYAVDDPEPYGTLAGRLQRQLGVVDAAVQELMGRFGSLQSAYRKVSLWTPQSLLRYPYDIYLLRKQVTELSRDAADTSGSMDSVERIRAELDQQAWTVASQARKALETDLNASRILADLQSSGVQDPVLETTIQDAQHWEQRLNAQVPAYFLGGDQAAVQSQADKHSVAQVYRLVDQARPAVDELLKKAQTWQGQQTALDGALRKLPDEFRRLADEVAELEGGTLHPVAWDQSRAPLSALRLQVERLGNIKKKRSLEQLVSDRQMSDDLFRNIQELAAHTGEVKQEHVELIKLLESPDLVQGMGWGRTTQKLAAQAGVYHPDNWPVEHSVTGLKDDLQKLDESHQRLSWDSAATPVRESELPDLLEEARKLEQMHAGLRPRAASIQARLEQVQAAERETRDSLSRSRALLNQAVPLLGANPLLTPGAVKEAESLRQEVEPLTADMEHPESGVMEVKKQKAGAFLRRADQAGRRWLGILETDLQKKKANLAIKVERLQGIALLDEPALNEAAGLVGGESPAGEASQAAASSEAAKKSAEGGGLMNVFRRKEKPETATGSGLPALEGVSLADAVGQLKQKNDEWQRCVALLRSLEDFEKPLLERYAKALEQREAARQITAKAIELIPDEKGWPPTQQSVSLERQQLDQLENRWETLRKTPTRAIQVVSSLGSLSEQYLAQANAVRQVVEKAQQEQTRFVDLESRLAESKHLWNQTMMEQDGNRAAQDAIRELLAEADQELASIRQRYASGALPFNQAFQVLRSLCQKLDSAQIPLDSQWEVDINGEKGPRGSG